MCEVFFILKDGTANLDQIGGTDSYLRRLVNAHGRERIELLYLSSERSEVIEDRLKIKKFTCSTDIYQYLKDKTKTPKIITNIPMRDKLILSRLDNTILLNFFYPKNAMIWIARIIELKLFQYKHILVPSTRLLKKFKKFHHSVIWLPPIIPESYLINEEVKKDKFSFIGRADPRKGLLEFLDLKRKFPEKSWYLSLIKIDRDFRESTLNKTLRNETVNWRDRKKYSHTQELNLIRELQETKVFFQTYQSLDSTVDLPLLLLEAQACGCVVITKNIDKFYANECCIILEKGINAETFFKKIPSRERIEANAKIVRETFGQSKVTQTFQQIL
jgi:glycosyltransferase involved in cell wall biosynthesis